MLDRNLIPIGIDDFGYLRQKNLVYVDKTHFVKRLRDHAGVQVFYFPGPAALARHWR
jgi:Predicted AAA-ATPase